LNRGGGLMMGRSGRRRGLRRKARCEGEEEETKARPSDPVFENWKQKILRQVNSLHFIKFEKIGQNVFDERKEHKFFKNIKIG
jgi:hypothetical protein